MGSYGVVSHDIISLGAALVIECKCTPGRRHVCVSHGLSVDSVRMTFPLVNLCMYVIMLMRPILKEHEYDDADASENETDSGDEGEDKPNGSQWARRAL